MLLTGSQILLETLIEQGTDVVFGYPGGYVINIYDALYEKRDRLRHVLCSHEQGAAHAADGYARSTGKVGVAIATSGPGATNLVTGIATAFRDSVPIVAITGNVTADLKGRDSFQEIDIISVTKSVVKKNYYVSHIEELAQTVKEAFAIASSGRKGPVLIDIPKDVAVASMEYTPAGRYELLANPVPDRGMLEKAVRALEASERPLIYCGGGVTFSDSSNLLLDFARKLHIPVCASMMGIAAVPEDFELNLGLVGMHGTAAANRAVAECDLLLSVGARFSDRVAGDRNKFAENAVVIHIDIDEREFSKNVVCDMKLHGHCGEIMADICDKIAYMRHPEWTHRMLEYKVLNPLPYTSSDEGINPREIITAIRPIFGDDTIIVTDVGQHQMLTAQYYPFKSPRSFLSSCGLGTMGYGMGAANGAAVGNPEKPVVLISGDGSFHMNLQEVAAAVSEKLNVVVLVFNNSVLGMVHQWQKIFFDGRFSATEINRKTDFAALGRAFGAQGLTLDSKDDINAVLTKAFEISGPCIVDCKIPVTERVFPFIPAGKTDDDMIYYTV